jgi:hypothetical protein
MMLTGLPTDEGIELLRRTKPLASLSRDFGRGIREEESPCSRPPGVVQWHLWTPGPIAGRSAFIVHEFSFEAVKLAALELAVEPGAVRVWGWT